MSIKIKRVLLAVALIAIFGLTPSPSYAGSFFDNFDDGNADGWWLGYSQHTPWVNGNWRVEDGMLVQDQAGDQFNALVENLQIQNQTTEAQLKINGPSGYGGITIWYQGDNNWVNVFIYPAAQEVWVIEHIDNTSNLSRYPYTAGANNTWYNLRIDVNSANGELATYINGVYLFTHNVNTPYRTGQSGVNNGNAGGYFDNFKITSNDIPPINIAIDIRPWSKHNLVRSEGYGILSVAIFSTEGFEAPNQIDQKSLTFGASGDEESLVFCNRRPNDISRDGSKDDLICYFSTKIAGFKCGDTEGILKGKTVGGVSVEGRDMIKVVGCK